MRAGWSEIGVRQLRRAEAMRPNAPIVLAHLADALDERGHSASAQKRRRRLAEILRSLGIAALLTRFEIDGGPPAASRSWEDPFLARVPVLVARYLRSRGELEAAREELLRGNQRYPGHCELMIEMGRDLMGRQEVNQAMDWFSSAVLVDPTCHEGYLESGFLHACKGHTHLAAHALRTAVTLRPLFADYRFHLGTLLLDTGETEQAIRELRTALTLQPGHSECALHLAGALARAGRAAEAVETLKSSSCRGWPEALFLLAECCLEIDLEEEARSALERLLSADPGDAKARALLETLKQAS
jgi:tetratricopeptide (TPR) repeat protein